MGLYFSFSLIIYIMLEKKNILKKKARVVTKVSVTDTLKSIKLGEIQSFTCYDFSVATARVVASRLKREEGMSFTIKSDSFGTSFTVQRNKVDKEAEEKQVV
nr:MAG TPA: hypothetical protein [Caudoviricetes sp.]